VRARIGEDGATPSGVGLMAEALVRLYHLTDAAEWREAAERLIAAFSGDPRRLAPIAAAAVGVRLPHPRRLRGGGGRLRRPADRRAD